MQLAVLGPRAGLPTATHTESRGGVAGPERFAITSSRWAEIVTQARQTTTMACKKGRRPKWFPLGLVSLVAYVVSIGICAKLFMSNDDLISD
jgi:hypothetical protein